MASAEGSGYETRFKTLRLDPNLKVNDGDIAKNSAYFRLDPLPPFEHFRLATPLPNLQHYVQIPSLLGLLRSPQPSPWDTSDSPSSPIIDHPS